MYLEYHERVDIYLKGVLLGVRIVFFSTNTVDGERGDAFDETLKSNPARKFEKMSVEIKKYFLDDPLFKFIQLAPLCVLATRLVH